MFEIIRGLNQIKDHHYGSVLTIGNFDGVHLGHRAILDEAKNQARIQKLPVTVLTFEPYPLEYIAHAPPARLTRLKEKLIALKAYGISRVVVAQFDESLHQMKAKDFIKNVIVQKLGAACVVVGDDFRFGKDRAGDFDTLTKAGLIHNFKTRRVQALCIKETRVSSSEIRAQLLKGDLISAKAFLGRDFTLRGRVAHGLKRGRQIGVPTANIHLHRLNTPIQGVYAVIIRGIGDAKYYGVANVGNRPTVDGVSTILEVNIFDFDEDIYGLEVEVAFLDKIRQEKRFSDFKVLTKQIKQDIVSAKEYFKLERKSVKSA